MTQQTPVPEAERDRPECGCSRFVKRCVHFDGHVITFWDSADLPEVHLGCQTRKRFVVLGFPAEGVSFETCDKCGTPESMITGPWDSRPTLNYRGNDEAHALAIFEAEEMRLLGRVLP